MARQAKNENIEAQFKRWVAHRGISLGDVLVPFTINHENGMTQITLTVIAQDFPVPPETLPAGEVRTDTQESCDTCSGYGCVECLD